MSTQTPNIGLTKPAGNERPYRSVINDNMDILDSKIGAVGNTDLQSQVTALVESVSQLLVVKEVSLGSITVNNTVSVNPWPYITTECPSGYKPIGIAGFLSNDVRIVFTQCIAADWVYAVQLRTVDASSVTSEIKLSVMYMLN